MIIERMRGKCRASLWRYCQLYGYPLVDGDDMTVLEEQTDKGYMLRIYVDLGRDKDGLMATYVYNKDSQEIEEKVYKRGWVEDYRRCFILNGLRLLMKKPDAANGAAKCSTLEKFL